MVLLTDGENPIEVEDWQATARKMNDLAVGLTIVYVAAYKVLSYKLI